MDPGPAGQALASKARVDPGRRWEFAAKERRERKECGEFVSSAGLVITPENAT